MRSFITRAAVDATCGVCICTCRDARPIRRRTDSELTPHRKVVPSPQISCILDCLYLGLCFTLILLSLPSFRAANHPSERPFRTHRRSNDQKSRGTSLKIESGMAKKWICLLRMLIMVGPNVYGYTCGPRLRIQYGPNDPFLAFCTHRNRVGNKGDLSMTISQPADSRKGENMPNLLSLTSVVSFDDVATNEAHGMVVALKRLGIGRDFWKLPGSRSVFHSMVDSLVPTRSLTLGRLSLPSKVEGQPAPNLDAKSQPLESKDSLLLSRKVTTHPALKRMMEKENSDNSSQGTAPESCRFAAKRGACVL